MGYDMYWRRRVDDAESSYRPPCCATAADRLRELAADTDERVAAMLLLTADDLDGIGPDSPHYADALAVARLITGGEE